MFNLNGKTALITGASRGIGKEIASTLHNAGAEVILSATNRDALQTLANHLKTKCHIIAANLGNKNEPEELAQNALNINGKIDILINNAAITKDQLAMRMSNQEWEDVLQVNLTAPFIITKNIIRAMMKHKYGRIINISSVIANTGNPGQANYAAAKAGLIAMSKSIAQEVATRGITINCIAPGFIETDMTSKLDSQIIQEIRNHIPMQKEGSPQDIAAATLFLASQEAQYITGETLHINGGMIMT